MRFVLLAIFAFVVAACDVQEAVLRIAEPAPTPHEKYAHGLRDAGLDKTALGREWLTRRKVDQTAG